jgi:RNA polymerase sigma-70 factor (ECF subfamily)
MGKRGVLNNEQELIQACSQGERFAQQQLFELYAEKMLGLCARYCTSMDDAKDALHEGFIKVFRQIPTFNAQAKLETWITRIMINTAIDHFKQSIKFKELNTEDMEAETYTLEYEKEREIPREKILECIRQLPDGYRIIFNLYAIEGYSHKEIAAQLDIREGTSKSQLSRARKLLQDIVIESGILG